LIGSLAGTRGFGFEERLEFFGGQFLDAVGGFFEHRILGDLRLNHVLQFQPVQLEQADHLHQTGG